MNKQEVRKFIDRTWGQGKSDMPTILKEIDLNKYKFDKDDIIEIFNSLYSKQGLTGTPNHIAELIANIGHLYEPTTAIDICCGTGNILHYLKNIKEIKGIDINHDIIQIAKAVNPEINFMVANSLEFDFGGFKYDLVVGSLPFGTRTNNKKLLEIELINKGLGLLNENGSAIFIVPEGILTNQNAREFRNQILSGYALDLVVSLPHGVFYPYTNIKTSIIVIRKGKPKESVFMADYEDNPQNIISDYKSNKGNFHLTYSKLNDRFDRSFYLSIEVLQEKLEGKEVKRLSEIANLVRGIRIDRNSLSRSGRYLVYGIRDKEKNGFYVNDVANEDAILKPNDIVVSLIMSDKQVYVHQAAAQETVISENYVIIRSTESSYINTYLQTPDGQDLLWQQARGKAKGSVLPRLSLSDLYNLIIPILPLSELNFLSEEWLKSATTEKLLQLENQLKGLISVYEIGSLHLNLTKEILIKVTSQEEITKRIEEKIDVAISALQELTSEISAIKNNKRDDDEKIRRIYYGIDEKLKQLTDQQVKEIAFYQNEIKKWLNDWQLLHSSSSTFLTSAELIFDYLPDGNDTDYSPFIIQYCRALENEILKKLFEAYHDFLVENNVDRKSLIASENANPKTQMFSKFVERDLRDYTLGNMSAIMSFLKEGGNTLKTSPLLQNFREFTLSYFEDKVLQKEFLDTINNITTNYRNKSAHPYILTLETAKECQRLIRHILGEFLINYKKRV